MIIVSCRKKFSHTRLLSARLQVRDYADPAHSDAHVRISLARLRARARGRRVCLLVHGFRHRLPHVLKSYAELQARMKASGVAGPAGYGLVVGFTWPGWNSAPGFLAARVTATRAAASLRRLVGHLRPVARGLDVQTHSLGARVALGALLQLEPGSIDNLLLTAPAVDDTILEPGRAFHDALGGCRRCFVYHSRKDDTLRKAYPLGDLADGIQPALGLNGPRRRGNLRKTCPNVYVVDCAARVPDHGAYRRADAYFRHWRRVLGGQPLARREKL